MKHKLLAALLSGAFLAASALAQAQPASSSSDTILLTVVLRHDQSKSLAEIQKIEEEQGFWKAFPPEGTKIVSWNVVMGIGQVVTLQVPAARLREVNMAIEATAWKAFRTEFYPTYDLYPFIKEKLKNSAKVTTE